MKGRFKFKIAAFVSFFVLAGTIIFMFQNCGGSGSGSGGATGNRNNFGATGSGSFIDDPVQGLYYVTSSGLTGLTDASGQFKYNPGDTVTFYAEGVLIGSLMPAPGTTGFTTATPLSLVPGATGVTDPTVTAIAQFLSSLNQVSVGAGSGVSGAFVIPTSSNSSSTSGGTVPSGATTTQLQTLLASALGGSPSSYAITSASAAQASLQNGLNTLGIVGSVWQAVCTTGCQGGAYLYFEPGGSVVGFSGDGSLTGTWSTDSSGNTTLSATDQTSNGGSAVGSIASGATSGTGTVTNSGGSTGSITLSRVGVSSGFSATSFEGAWYVTYTPYTATSNNNGGTAYCIFGPGTFYCLTNDGQLFTGSYDNSGTGSFSFSDNSGNTNTGNFTLSTYSGTVQNSKGGGTLSFSRSGTFTVTKNNGGGSPAPDPTP